jgi:hypothetical protein
LNADEASVGGQGVDFRVESSALFVELAQFVAASGRPANYLVRR